MLKHILILLTIGAAACDSGPAITPLGVRARRSALSGEGVDASAAAHLDLTTLRAELLAADAAYADSATRTNLIEAIVAPLAADAVFLAPGAGIARGPDAARAILAANPANATSKWRWTAARGDVSSDGQRGYTFGYSEIVLENGTVLPGRYQAYWSKQIDGHWKIASYRRVARGPGAVTIEPPDGFRTPTNKHRRYFPNTDSTAEAAAVASADKAFSDLAQRVAIGEAFERYAAPTAAHTGGPVEWAYGPAAIAAVHAGQAAGLFSWSPEVASVAASGDLGFTVGFVRQGETVIGKYFTVWQKQDTGKWLFIVD